MDAKAEKKSSGLKKTNKNSGIWNQFSLTFTCLKCRSNSTTAPSLKWPRQNSYANNLSLLQWSHLHRFISFEIFSVDWQQFRIMFVNGQMKWKAFYLTDEKYLLKGCVIIKLKWIFYHYFISHFFFPNLFIGKKFRLRKHGYSALYLFIQSIFNNTYSSKIIFRITI